MDTKTLTKGISDDDWAGLAKLANTTPQQIRSRYEAALAGHPGNLRVKNVTRGNSVKSGDCIRRDFDISLFDLIGLNGYFEFCGTSSTDWNAAVHVCLNVAGAPIWCTDFTLTPSNAQICYSPQFTVVTATLCFAIQGSNLCFNVSGQVFHWAFGWKCEDFNETLFCCG